MFFCSCANSRPKIVRWNDSAGFTLDGLHQHCGHTYPDFVAYFELLLDCTSVTVWDVVNRSRVEQPTRCAVVGLANHRQRPHRLAMKGFNSDNKCGLACVHLGELQGGLHRLCAAG